MQTEKTIKTKRETTKIISRKEYSMAEIVEQGAKELQNAEQNLIRAQLEEQRQRAQLEQNLRQGLAAARQKVTEADKALNDIKTRCREELSRARNNYVAAKKDADVTNRRASNLKKKATQISEKQKSNKKNLM